MTVNGPDEITRDLHAFASVSHLRSQLGVSKSYPTEKFDFKSADNDGAAMDVFELSAFASISG